MKRKLAYLLVILFWLFVASAAGQTPCKTDGLCVVQFNASFNAQNKVPWVGKLKECDTKFIDIAADQKAAATYKIVVVPTIVIYIDGQEVARFHANIMMTMEATQKEVQSKIDEIIMEGF